MMRWLVSLVEDLRHGARALRRTPTVAVMVIVTLAVGIGTNSALFSIVDAIVIQPLPYPDSERLVLVGVRSSNFGSGIYGHSGAEYAAIRDGVDAIEAIGIYDWGGGTLTGDGADPAEPTSLGIDVEFQEVLSLNPMLGRRFSADDCADGAAPVLMIGEELWRGRYHADPEIVGRMVEFEGVATEIIGVVPATFRFPEEMYSIQVWRPTPFNSMENMRSVGIVAKLGPSSDQRQADAQVAAVASSFAESRPDTNVERSFFVRPLRENVVGNVRTPLLLLWVAVGFVLLLACMNAANLLLARGFDRTHEIAIRAAVGAPRWRVVQSVLGEAVVLSLAAAAAGLLIAQWCIEGIVALGADSLPRGNDIAIDARAFAFTAVAALVTGLLSGILPAWQLSRPNLAGMIQQCGNRTTGDRVGQRVRAALTVGQIAIAFVLLIGAGLTIRSSLVARATDPGFAYENTMGMTMWPDKPRDSDDDWTVRFYDPLRAQIAAVPGVLAVGLVSGMPWQHMFDNATTVRIDGHPAFADDEPTVLKYRITSANYLEMSEVPLLEGRYLSEADDADSPPVVVVSRELAERYWPDRSAVGQTMQVGKERSSLEIVGVVGGVRERRLEVEPVPMLYIPHRQERRNAMTVMVRTEGDPTERTRAIQQAVWDLAPTQGIWRTTTLESLLDATMVPDRLFTIALVAFACVAVLLAAVGIYGVISFSVTQRTRELGIRIALGARDRSIIGQVLTGGLRLAAIGLLIGVPAAYGLSGFLESRLFGVTRLDAKTYVAVVALVGLIGTMASLIPAWRATRVEPVESLRG